MGAATYRVPGGLPSPYPHLRQYVVSRSIHGTPDDVTVVSGDLIGWVRALKAEEGLDIWLCGGSALAGQLLPEIDRLFLKVSPVVLGRGLPLFAAEVADSRFTRTAVRPFGNGVTFLQYDRTREAQRSPESPPS